MKSIVHWFIELLFPTQCLGCRRYGSGLCPQCLRVMPSRQQQECIVCKRSSRNGAPCRACQPHTMIDQLLIAGHADHPLLTRAIHNLKYSRIQSLAQPLSDYAFTALAGHDSIDLTFTANPLIIAVPLHARRQAGRGFNQSALIARHLAGHIGMEYSPNILKRIRHTESQVGTSSRWERLDNMKDAFACADAALVTDRDIVIIDDVCTTGATLDACAKALKETGARHVSAIVLARG